MDAIAGVTARVAAIENRFAQLSVLAQGAQAATAATATGRPTAAGTTAAGGTTMMGGATATGRATATTGTSFATALADAVAATRPMATSAKLNAKGIPVELAAYGNGKIPKAALDEVGNTGQRLWAPAAASMENLLAAARRDGVKIGITDSYRPYGEQVDLVRRKGLYSQGGLAAKPGTSDHGWGMAVDLDLNSKAQAWMRANGPRFGFVEDTPREPWHWGYTPKS